MFYVTDNPIDHQTLREELYNKKAGALDIFEGWVRNRNEGHDVQALEYEAYPELCNIEMEKIISEAQEKYQIVDIRCVHRVGLLQLGEMAVWLGVTSIHREDAFAACRFIIDELKVRLPIWKKEHYVNQESQWVNCQTCAKHQHRKDETKSSEAQFYEKQTQLNQVGEAGQKKLKNSSVLVIGAGGLGSPALQYLSASGIGHIGICDGDRIEVSNLNRQTLYSIDQVGQFKVDMALNSLRKQNPFVHFRGYKEKISAENIENIAASYDIVVDCTDNFKTKFLLHDFCQLSGKTLVQSSVYQYEGQIQVYQPNQKGCLRCIYPETPAQECVGNCQDSGVIGAVAGTFGSLQAMLVIKEILGLNTQSGLWIFNLLTMESQTIQTLAKDTCPICSDDNLNSFFNIETRESNSSDYSWSLKFDQIKFHQYVCVDLRESHEATNAPSPIDSVNLPMDQIWNDLEKLPNSQPTLLFCQKGFRSYQATERLREMGYSNIYSLKGGLDTLS